MSTQIAVRLQDELVTFLDQQVKTGRARSRADLISAALEREMRRAATLNDVEILKRVGIDDDLDSLVAWTSSQPLED